MYCWLVFYYKDMLKKVMIQRPSNSQLLCVTERTQLNAALVQLLDKLRLIASFTNWSALLTGTHLGEEELLGISLLFLSDSCDGGGINAGLDPGGGSPDNLFGDGGSGETKQSKDNKCYKKHSYALIKNTTIHVM